MNIGKTKIDVVLSTSREVIKALLKRTRRSLELSLEVATSSRPLWSLFALPGQSKKGTAWRNKTVAVKFTCFGKDPTCQNGKDLGYDTAAEQHFKTMFYEHALSTSAGLVRPYLLTVLAGHGMYYGSLPINIILSHSLLIFPWPFRIMLTPDNILATDLAHSPMSQNEGELQTNIPTSVVYNSDGILRGIGMIYEGGQIHGRYLPTSGSYSSHTHAIHGLKTNPITKVKFHTHHCDECSP